MPVLLGYGMACMQGPTYCMSTGCTTGIHSIGHAALTIATGVADVMVAGGTEVECHPFIIGGFCRAKSACTQFNGNPEKASRPFDARRCGFVPSEGAGIMILEELELISMLRYFGIVSLLMPNTSQHHLSEDGDGEIRAMKQALSNACKT